MCSTSFTTLGHAQSQALGYPDLPIAVIPHPFGLRSREEVREIANRCADDVAHIAHQAGESQKVSSGGSAAADTRRAQRIEAPDDHEGFNRFCRDRRWSDGLPLVPPTPERVATMLQHTQRKPDDVVAQVAPGFGEATVERIAVNAVLAGCAPEYLPLLIGGVEAFTEPAFNLQGIQATTNPATPWIIVNGPLGKV